MGHPDQLDCKARKDHCTRGLEPIESFENLPKKAREIAPWRKEQLQCYESWLQVCSKAEIDHLLKQVEIPAGYGLKRLSRHALQLWRKVYCQEGLYGLAPKNGRRGRKVAGIPKKRIVHISALYCAPLRPKLTDCLRQSFRHQAFHPKENIHEIKTYKAAMERTIETVVFDFFRAKGKWNDSIFPYVKRDKSNLEAFYYGSPQIEAKSPEGLNAFCAEILKRTERLAQRLPKHLRWLTRREASQIIVILEKSYQISSP